jgi:hypothetical protein
VFRLIRTASYDHEVPTERRQFDREVNGLKGRIAEAFVESIFRRAGYTVSRIGRESQVQRLVKIGSDEFLPDFLVRKQVRRDESGRPLHRLLPVEVKYRRDVDRFLQRYGAEFFGKLSEQWPELCVVFVTDEPSNGRSCFQIVEFAPRSCGSSPRAAGVTFWIVAIASVSFATASQTTAFGTGLRFLPVDHAGNVAAAPEEAERVAREIASMVGGSWTNRDGVTAPLGQRDFMVVAPYNAQVRSIRRALEAAGLGDVPVGTVDKFQGREAAVVFYSMATSSAEDVPRSLEFLFSRNRLNVAVSRAMCLACIVASPRLLESRARTIEQMRLINALCRFVEMAGEKPSESRRSTEKLEW